MAENVPRHGSVCQHLGGLFSVSLAVVDCKLSAILTSDRKLEELGILGYDGTVAVFAERLFDLATGIISLENPEMALGPTKEPTKRLGLLLRSGVTGQGLLSELPYDGEPDVRRAEKALSAALVREIALDLRLAGTGHPEVSERRVEDGALIPIACATCEIGRDWGSRFRPPPHLALTDG